MGSHVTTSCAVGYCALGAKRTLDECRVYKCCTGKKVSLKSSILHSTVSHESHDPFFHGFVMDAGVMTYMASCSRVCTKFHLWDKAYILF